MHMVLDCLHTLHVSTTRSMHPDDYMLSPVMSWRELAWTRRTCTLTAGRHAGRAARPRSLLCRTCKQQCWVCCTTHTTTYVAQPLLDNRLQSTLHATCAVKKCRHVTKVCSSPKEEAANAGNEGEQAHVARCRSARFRCAGVVISVQRWCAVQQRHGITWGTPGHYPLQIGKTHCTAGQA